MRIFSACTSASKAFPVGGQPSDLTLLGKDDRLQRTRVVGKRIARNGHGRALPENRRPGTAISSLRYTTRDGGAVQAGRRQSMPSQSMASCAEVSRTAPSAGDGQGKRPFSSTL